MFIATGRNSSGETWSSSWIQFVNLRNCERFNHLEDVVKVTKSYFGQVNIREK